MCVINIKEPMVLVNPKLLKEVKMQFNILKVVYHYQKQWENQRIQLEVFRLLRNR